MGWRTIIVRKNCKLTFKNDYLVIRTDELQMIHLSEINTIIVENGMASITSYLINELAQNKIKIIFCDEKHNPSCELMPYYGSYDTSKKILAQTKWNEERKALAWQKIVKMKIINQAKVLEKNNINGFKKLYEYVEQVEIDDKTNREGHAAKVYFNLLFGKQFIRGSGDDTNIALDYGYSILLSLFNREIVNKGYLTPLGIKHKNEFNQFNLSCDLMETYRPLVDEIVFKNKSSIFDKEFKEKLIELYNAIVIINGQEQYLNNAVRIYITNVFNYLEERESKIINYEF